MESVRDNASQPQANVLNRWDLRDLLLCFLMPCPSFQAPYSAQGQAVQEYLINVCILLDLTPKKEHLGMHNSIQINLAN